MTKRLKFFCFNLLLVSSMSFFLILSMNGTGNAFPIKILIGAILISAPIIYLQYSALNFKKNWLYKTLIFYLSMVVFLFIFGAVQAWNSEVGSYEAGTWLARFDAGLTMILFGQFFGGLFAFVIVTALNFALRKHFFEN